MSNQIISTTKSSTTPYQIGNTNSYTNVCSEPYIYADERDPNNKKCIDKCPEGSYCSDGNIVQKCFEGAFCPGYPSIIPYTCPEGYKCPEGSVYPIKCMDTEKCLNIFNWDREDRKTTDCPAGTYFNTSKNTCELCPSGFYCTTGSTSGKPCPDGASCPAGVNSPVMCPPGWDYDSNGYCVCPKGQICSCPAGKYNYKGVCKTCNYGTYCPTGSTSAQSCPAGSYCPTPSEIVNCPVNSNADQKNNSCICKDGKYYDKNNNSCKCPAGYFCPQASSAQNCPAGYYCPDNSTSASACKTGSYCPQGSKSEQTCPAGYYCPDSKTLKPCLAGTYNASTGATLSSACKACPFNWWNRYYKKSADGWSQCVDPCPAGLWKSDYNKCAYCMTPGKVCINEKQIDCPAGSYCPKNPKNKNLYDTQIACPAGSYCPVGSTSPNPCPIGKTFKAGSTSSLDCK